MKGILMLSASLLFHFFGYTQEFNYLNTRDGVDVAYKYGKNAVTLQFKNQNNQKVYVSIGDIIWIVGERMVGKSNGGGLTLASGETSSFGMFFNYPTGYDNKNYQSLRFKVEWLKVEIGGMGNDPRYQKTQTKSNNTTVVEGQGLPEINFNKGATREPGSNEWKAMPPSNEIKFPGDEKPANQKPNATETTPSNKAQPSTPQSPEPNLKKNGLSYSNGTAIENNTKASNTGAEKQKQNYQNQADNYLNNAQDKNQSSISQNLNLDLAKTNAMMAGNQQQVQEIQQMQNQQRQQSNEQLFNTLQSGIQNIADLLAQKSQKKAEAQRRQFELEQQRREQRLQAQMDEDRRKQAEEDRINREMMTQFSIDSFILSNNNLSLKTSAINPKIDSVYYVGYKRQYNEQRSQLLFLKVFVVYRYSDGTFPLFSKVTEKSNHKNNIDQDEISLLIGFFQSKSDVSKVIEELKVNAMAVGISPVIDTKFRQINFATTTKAKDDNFWNQ